MFAVAGQGEAVGGAGGAAAQRRSVTVRYTESTGEASSLAETGRTLGSRGDTWRMRGGDVAAAVEPEDLRRRFLARCGFKKGGPKSGRAFRAVHRADAWRSPPPFIRTPPAHTDANFQTLGGSSVPPQWLVTVVLVAGTVFRVAGIEVWSGAGGGRGRGGKGGHERATLTYRLLSPTTPCVTLSSRFCEV